MLLVKSRKKSTSTGSAARPSVGTLTRKGAVDSLDSVGRLGSGGGKKGSFPRLEDFLTERDYSSALVLLKYNNDVGKGDPLNDLWKAYAHVHLGMFEEAKVLYEALLSSKKLQNFKRSELELPGADAIQVQDEDIRLWVALCDYYLGLFPEARNRIQTINESSFDSSVASGQKSLVKRLKLLLEVKLAPSSSTEISETMKQLHEELSASSSSELEQLTGASMHFYRAQYQEAIDVYKKLLADKKDTHPALQVYAALAYYKLDYYDVSQDVLTPYLNLFPNSLTAINLKACNHYRLYHGKAAESELRAVMENMPANLTYAEDIIKHNLVVFRGGENALQILPPLVDALPEARLNLIIYYLKSNKVEQAYQLVKDIEPTSSQEYTLKGIVFAILGQLKGSKELLKKAQHYYHVVGSSLTECDTIPGRQAMASYFFLIREFDDVLLYLSSIKSYFYNDETFNFNFAQAKAMMAQYREAQELLLLIESPLIREDYTWLSLLARSYIMNRDPQSSWELYLTNESHPEAFNLLLLIANDSYKMGHFLHAARAFDVLGKMDPNPEFWEGKRGACCGLFQKVIAGEQPRDSINEVIQLLRSTSPLSQIGGGVEHLVKVMKTWLESQKTKTSQ